MKKIIRVAMNYTRCEELGLCPHAPHNVREMDVELDSYDGVKRWILDHITATTVADEGIDVQSIYVQSKYSKAEIDRIIFNKSDQYIESQLAFDEDYGTKKDTVALKIHELTRTLPTLESVLDYALKDISDFGAEKLIDRSTGDTYFL